MQLFYYTIEMEKDYREKMEIIKRNVVARITQEEPENEDDALRIIAEEVFSFKGIENLSYEDKQTLIQKLFFKIRCKLNILQPLIDDEDISEIMVNGFDYIFYEKNGLIYKYETSFDNEEELEDVMQSIAAYVHREINELHPIVDARLKNGSRVNGVYKNIAVNGHTMTIRKFSKKHMRMEQLIENGTLTDEAARLLRILVTCGYNIFISGGTSSGKTTLINALSDYIGKNERVIVIEDSTELKISNVINLVQLECRNENALGKGQVTMSDLIKNSLRMRPDRLIIGEIRGKEACDLLQALNTGHAGMSTGHGNSVDGMLKRLETLYLMAVTMDVQAIREQIAEGIDVLVHIDKINDRRQIVEITELLAYEKGSFVKNRLMCLRNDGTLVFTGNPLYNDKKIRLKGVKYDDELRELGLKCFRETFFL